ncbi:MAG: bifunctional folylpolyglutamate synthase/dihydrofolate synthase [Bacteroidales bacterium]|nr:bifunctional folylpolyglutamate synthase/dihydrofolate synthase [Bacteroidales bacterium]
MDYIETIDWMIHKLPMFQRVGGAAYRGDLDNTVALLALIKQPQKKFRTVHIAGTNGKGSVSHLIASILQDAGYKTGLYTSPHLKDFRERIRINGEMIPHENVIAFIEKYRNDFEKMNLSFFEMTVGMAFEYFALEDVDIAVIETGMGGRLDSTNLITPLVSVITNIGLDHTQFLGETLAAIAAEKAGIIKENVPVVIGETQTGTTDVFSSKAEVMHATIVYADQQFSAKKLESTQQNIQIFDVWKNSQMYLERLEIPLLGYYQQKNIVTALCAVEQLKAFLKINDCNIREGVANVIRRTGLMGRWQILGRSPLIIADTGHNQDGIKEVVLQLKQLQYNHLHIVLGMVNDKNIDAILQLLPHTATYYFCKADIPRGLDAHLLAVKADEFGLRGEVFDSVWNAYYRARHIAKYDDIVFVGGSTFVVAEVV